MNLKRTPLHATHLACGARLVDFGGWSMPVAYGSQIDEHHAVRRAAGVFDVSHMCAVDLDGADVRGFLRVLLANHVDRLQRPGKALYSVMLNEAGGCVDDLIVYYLAEDRFRAVVNASTADDDLAWMERVRAARGLRVSVLPRRDLAMLALQGPLARERLWAVRPQWRGATEPLEAFFAVDLGDAMIARTGYTGEDGFEITLPAAQAPVLWDELLGAGVVPCGLGARDTLRLEAGMNLYGNDMDATVSPLDAGLGWTVDLKSPRDFVGRAALETRGRTRAFVGLVLLERGVIRAHQRVVTPHGDGEVTSGSFSPTLETSIGLARVPLPLVVGDTVQVELRGRLVPARVVKPPFVRHGRVLV